MTTATGFVQAVVLGASKLNPALSIAIGERLTASGNITTVYARVKVPGKPTSIKEAIGLLAELGGNTVRVSIPSIEGGKLKLTLSPEITAERACVLACVYGGFDLPTSIPVDRVKAHLSACGVTEEELDRVAAA